MKATILLSFMESRLIQDSKLMFVSFVAVFSCLLLSMLLVFQAPWRGSKHMMMYITFRSSVISNFLTQFGLRENKTHAFQKTHRTLSAKPEMLYVEGTFAKQARFAYPTARGSDKGYIS